MSYEGWPAIRRSVPLVAASEHLEIERLLADADASAAIGFDEALQGTSWCSTLCRHSTSIWSRILG
jgi:hypothetical protein